MKSQAQRGLMHAAAETPGGVGGVPQAVGKDFAAADQPGKLPEKVSDKKPSPANKLYRGKKVAK